MPRVNKPQSIANLLPSASISIEKTEATLPVSSIELPAVIEQLITGVDYWRRAKTNRYKKLAREGLLRDLLELAEVANDSG